MPLSLTKTPHKVNMPNPSISAKQHIIKRFHFPREHGAWWTFITCMAAGLLGAILSGGSIALAVSLAIPMVAIFLISDWVSALSGAFLDEKIDVDLKAWQPWAFISLGVASLVFFASHLPRAQWNWWASAMVIQTACVSAMFLLRQELPSRDIRLLLLSSFLLTSPVLLLEASSLGWDQTKVWEFWIWPALFYPAGVLYVKGWMSGKLSRGLRLSSATLPYIILAMLAGLRAHWLAVSILAFIVMRAITRIRRRLLENGSRIPAIKDIRRFGWEQVSIGFLFTAVWLWTFLGELPH